MTRDLIQVNYLQKHIGTRIFKTKFIAEVTHTGLNDFKILTSFDFRELENKVKEHKAKLNEKWNKFNTVKTKEESIKEAELLTKDALNSLNVIENILQNALNANTAISWEKLKDNSSFVKISPENELSSLINVTLKPNVPTPFELPSKPDQSNFQPKFSFLDKIIRSKKENKINAANLVFEKSISDWERICKKIDEDNNTLNNEFKIEVSIYENRIEQIKKKNKADIQIWEKEKADFSVKRDKFNSQVDVFKNSYLAFEPNSIIDYCQMILENSQYPESFPKGFEIDYNSETKILILEYSLPPVESFPSLNEVKFVKNEFKKYYISDTQLLKLFESTMYNITLRTIFELFQGDVINAIDAISFNGWVNSINKATGKHENNCILSIQIQKKEFKQINLRQVDPKVCFKNFKGVGSSKLSGLTPIQPILQINKTDKRFTNHYDVADSLDSSTNLASMDWEDFEHLIREVFGKEFSSNGGEVKVTQASRDGGVDAIAFDPDPIRGGKIVIQAKRYTNTVGVSAVRDLYGTVMNEGATKGILVTTADYGPDAYEFVKGKPLTLMNGANLLYLLEKHGHHARINIKEARESKR